MRLPRLACVVSFLVSLTLLETRPGWASEPVQVRIFEGLPKGWTWQASAGKAADSYGAPALGIVQLPTKYNDRGIEVDRKSPFAVCAEGVLVQPPGPYHLILRARGRAWLVVDGVVLAETKAITPNASGHEEVPAVIEPPDPRWHAVAPGEQEQIIPWMSDGQLHKVALWGVVGEHGTRPEPGDLSVAVAATGRVPILVGANKRIELTDAAWAAFLQSERDQLEVFDTNRRRLAAQRDAPYWRARHAYARQEALKSVTPAAANADNVIDRRIRERLDAAKLTLRPRTDDAAFFRRMTLDTIGVIPDASEVAAFLADTRPDKRVRAIDARLVDARWADAWMGYWQDVLAENPGLIKPTLNNTGPFREFLHNAFADNLAFDRFATELIRMDGSLMGGGPAGFGIATQNDAPWAAKAHVLAKAFLAVDLKCARCHDAPSHPYDQADLFGLAGFLDGKPQTIPVTSTVPRQPGGRQPAVSVSLEAGDKVDPSWNLTDIAPAGYPLPAHLAPKKETTRERLATLITAPRNGRFSQVIVNRMWKRYLGIGLVEPVDDWDDENATPSHPELLQDLARELMTHDYDLKAVARVILNSETYQAEVDPDRAAPAASAEKRLFAGPARRRMSAEQMLDSLFTAAGKSFNAEDLDVEPQGRRPPHEMLNLGNPRHAWELASTSNERDRPSLSLPVVQSLVDVLQAFGWRPNRQDPLTTRDDLVTPLQPAIIANGVVGNRVARLSDDSAITELCLKDQPAEALIRALYLRVLSRPPSKKEVDSLVAFLGESYRSRIVHGALPVLPSPRGKRRVSWSNHLSPEATRIQLAEERDVRAGDPPTARLTTEFRERMEDVVWALVNSPEFMFVP